MKLILDACCGSGMFTFEKDNSKTMWMLFMKGLEYEYRQLG